MEPPREVPRRLRIRKQLGLQTAQQHLMPLPGVGAFQTLAARQQSVSQI